jgi:hypothetical protein
VIATIKLFRDEYVYHIEHGKCKVHSQFKLRTK